MRALSLLSALVLFSGCAAEFDIEDEGTFTVELGEFNDACELAETDYPAEGDSGSCAVTHALLGDQTCQITSICTGLTVLDTQAIREEIDSLTGSSDNAETELSVMSMSLTSLEMSAPTPPLTELDMSAESVKEQPALTIFSIGLGDAQTLIAGGSVEVFSADSPDDPFLTQINAAIQQDEPLPVDTALVVGIPLEEVQSTLVSAGEVTATVGYAVEGMADGTICLFGCDQ